MILYRKKSVTIETITFDDLVAHGIASGGNVVNGMPWSVAYAGQPIKHESDDCYLIPALEGTVKMTRGDMLITGVKGEIYPCKGDIFDATYESAAATSVGASMNFGQALAAIKAGCRITRAGWNGKGMAVELAPATTAMNTFMTIQNVNGSISTWVSS